MSKSVHSPEDFRQSVINELVRIAEEGPVEGRTTADRNYLLALGLIEKIDGKFRISPEGRAFVFDHALSDKVMMA